MDSSFIGSNCFGAPSSYQPANSHQFNPYDRWPFVLLIVQKHWVKAKCLRTYCLFQASLAFGPDNWNLVFGPLLQVYHISVHGYKNVTHIHGFVEFVITELEFFPNIRKLNFTSRCLGRYILTELHEPSCRTPPSTYQSSPPTPARRSTRIRTTTATGARDWIPCSTVEWSRHLLWYWTWPGDTI